MTPFRFAIMGAGAIARKFCDAVSLVEGCCVTAVASKSMERAQRFAREKHIPQAFDSYEQMLREHVADCVYIATTPDAHAALTRLCVKHDVPVLCEKAMFMNSADASEVFALAEARRVFTMEALWSRFLPAMRQARRWVREGRIGTPVIADMDLGFVAPQDASARYLNLSLGGGAAYDLTVYGIQLLSYVLDRDMVRVQAETVRSETGVDATEALLIRFAGQVPAVVRASFMAPMEERMVICGTAGRIVVPHAHYASSATLYDGKGAEVACFRDEETQNGFTYEIEEVRRCIAAGLLESSTVPHSATLACAQVFDLIAEQTRAQGEAPLL